MPTLPSGDILSSGIEYQQFPSRTWNINKETGRIEGEADRLPSVRQAAEIILNVNRFQWQIYRPYSGSMFDGLLGQESGFVAAELQRRIKDALSVDNRIQSITDFSFSMDDESMYVSFRVLSVYGVTDPVEVTIS